MTRPAVSASSSDSPPSVPAEAAGRRQRHAGAHYWRWALGILAALVAAFIACEMAGWPFLARPLEHLLAKVMQREVRLGDEQGGGTRIHLFGSLRIDTPGLRIGAPDWSREPYFVDAGEISLSLPYSALLQLRGGRTLQVRSLDIGRLSVRAERDAEARASWQFGEPSGKPKAAGRGAIPEFGRLQVRAGDVTYDDVPLDLHIDASVRTDEGGDAARRDAAAAPGGLKVELKGHYRKTPLAGRLESSGALALVARGAQAVPVRLELDAGRMSLRFAGTASDPLSLGGLTGVFKASGPSLAAVGEPLHVTLPSTGAFSLDGRLRKDGLLWNIVVDRAVVGSSRLSGAFQYDRRPAVPTLNGDLESTLLLLADLAPTVGAAPAGKTTESSSGRRLPQREFDLPSLRAMNASVRIDIRQLDLGTAYARPFSPVRGLLVLKEGVLTIDQLDAATADGRVRGMVRLDGTAKPARFETDLRLDGIDLARWLVLPRKGSRPPYLTGRLDGSIKLKGAGNSTAALLGSADGRLRASVHDGSVSHLVVEAAGIDLAQGLGMLVKGDDALPMSCAVADFGVKDGVLRPNAVIVDTRDSTISVDGKVSLADERLDLRAVVSPKDFSPLALRTPVLLRGSFAKPQVTLEAAPIARKVAGSVLLGLINPLAALIPFIDTGEGRKESSGCRELAARLHAGAKTVPDGAAPSTASDRDAAPPPAKRHRAARPMRHP